jgi:hypothetical protein
MPDARHERARDLVSDEEAEELGAPKYREADTVTILLRTGYSATKAMGKSNFIKGRGQGRSSAYPNLIPRVSNAVGGEAILAGFLEKGLMDMPEFEAAIKSAPEAVQNQVQFVLVLLINEIVGRSTSNLIEIIATLQKTKDQPARRGGAKKGAQKNQLLRRLLERCLFAPKGGQQLSRIGHGELDDKLRQSLSTVLVRNRVLYQSLATKLEAKTPEELVVKVRPLYQKFEDNFHTNVQFLYE